MSDWTQSWSEIVRGHQDAKDSQGAILELFELYTSLDPAERRAANDDLFAALHDGVEDQRYDALAIINEFGVTEALPHLRELAVRLQLDNSPGGPFELAKVERMVTQLTSRGR